MGKQKNAPQGGDTPNEASVQPELTKGNTNEPTPPTTSRRKLASKGVNRSNESLVAPKERWVKGGRPSEVYLKRLRNVPMKLKAPESCWVEDCEEEADVSPHLFKRYIDWDLYEWGVDEYCPFLCADHAIDDETARGRLGYLYTEIWATWVIYRPVQQPVEVCI